MASVTVDWRGDQVLADVAAAVLEGMDLAGKTLAASTVSKVSTPYPPASRPGQPPHARRGRSGGLAGAITHKVTRQGPDVLLSVGVPAGSANRRQAESLEQGTGRMRARPFTHTREHAEATATGYVEGAVRAKMGRS